MKNNATTRVSGGAGFTGLLQIAFIVLKLIGKINWSWGWVLAPTWISIIFWALMVMIAVILINKD